MLFDYCKWTATHHLRDKSNRNSLYSEQHYADLGGEGGCLNKKEKKQNYNLEVQRIETKPLPCKHTPTSA